MLNKFYEIKNHYNKLGSYTKFIIKISLIFVFSCLLASITCFLLKDISSMYIFLYRVSEELLIATRSCAFLGLVLMIISCSIEKR